MKWSARLGAIAWFLIMVVCLFFWWKPPVAKAGVQDQEQASTLAVPDQPAELPYAGAIVVVQCKDVVALVIISHDGKQHPLDLKTYTPAMVTTQLLQVPADGVTQVEVSCKLEVIKGSGSV